MDLKKKLKNILQKDGLKKVSNVLKVNTNNSAELIFPPAHQLLSLSRDSESEIRSTPSNPEADDAILEQIDPLFFTTNFDPSLFELQKLGNPLELEKLTSTRQRLLTELTVVSKRVFQLILDKQSSYTGEIQRIREIEDDLVAAIFTCQEARTDLTKTKKEFTSKSLGIIANHQKRQENKVLLNSLKTIQALRSTESRLNDLLGEDNYLGAIQLLLEFQKTAQNYSHFNCIAELAKKLMETMETAEEQLDMALSKVCLHFDEKHYAKLQTAYKLLGKTQTCVDQLLMHYASAIHNTAFSVVHGFAELCRPVEDSSMNLQKKPYPDLCSCLNSDIFIPCLTDLCKSMWKILVSYWRLLSWHSANSSKAEDEIRGSSTYEEHQLNPKEEVSTIDSSEDYVDQKLQHGAIRIWQDIQTKIKTFLLACDFSGFKIDDFLTILSTIHTLTAIGKEFCGSNSESLRNCIREASLRYFLIFHHTKLEELKIFIENEGWQICPVRSDFDIHQLHEFKFLKNCTNTFEAGSNCGDLEEEIRIFLCEEIGTSENCPFDIQRDSSEEDIYASSTKEFYSCRSPKSDSEVTSNLSNLTYPHEDVVEENGSENLPSPFITNTSLSILRLFGKYLNLMYLLQPIATDVAISTSQLFDYYAYAIFVFFGSENGEMTIGKISNTQLRAAFNRIQSNLITGKDANSDQNYSFSEQIPELICTNESIHSVKMPQPIASPLLDLKASSDLYGFCERVIACESSVFLSEQLDFLRSFISQLIPVNDWDKIAQLIDQSQLISDGLRRLVLGGVSSKAIHYQETLDRMETVNWEVKELMSQHNSYVDFLLRELQVLAMTIDELVQGRNIQLPIPLVTIFWEQIFKLCCKTFVEGFASTKRCSNSGRGLMQLDFAQFTTKLDKISPVSLKSLPDRTYVDSYIKAYYMPEATMQEWIRSNPGYTQKQLGALINCAWNTNKKIKQNLNGIVNELFEKE